VEERQGHRVAALVAAPSPEWIKKIWEEWILSRCEHLDDYDVILIVAVACVQTALWAVCPAITISKRWSLRLSLYSSCSNCCYYL
jgi:hypothetical protein